jgi:short-subunit dehydrogenase
MNKVIIITGASDGIGAEIARQLAHQHQSGVTLVLAARTTAALDTLALECRNAGAQALVVPTDVTQPAACEALVQAALNSYGRIDTLINNAGMSAHARLDEVASHQLGWYQDLMQVNLWGSVWCTHAALPHLKASRGRIVAVSSLAGLVGVPGRTAYCATKFAMNGFFESLRVELLEHGVSVTLAYPGVVDTRIRYRGYAANGEPAGQSGLDESGAMPVAVCARLIIRGMEQRRRDVVMTFKGRLGRWLKLLAPSLVDRLALKAVKASHR